MRDRVTYLGTHPKHVDPITRATLHIYSDGIAVRGPSKPETLLIEASELHTPGVDGPDDVHNRVTVPRVLALGVLAIAVPKREEVAYLVAETADGEVIIECRRTGVMELRSAIQPLTRSLADAFATVTSVGARAASRRVDGSP